MGIFDTHAHYMKNDFGEDLYPLLAELPCKNVERVLAIGVDLESSQEEIDLAARYDYIYAAAGIHPEHAADLPEDWESRLEELLKRDKVVALGEIGLDNHYPEPPKEVQREVFVKQLEMAKRLDKTVIIHSREAMGETLELLKEYKPRGVMHCFSGSVESMREVVKLGMYIGFTGALTFKNSLKARAVCAETPIDRLLLETDCPYLAPIPFRGKRSDSSMIQYTAAVMAELKGVSTEEMIETARKNGERLFFGEEQK